MRRSLRNKLKLKRAKKTKKQATASPPSPPPPWLELPREVTADILHRLGAHEILESAQKVCTVWRNVCKDPSMWRIIDMKNLGEYHDMSDYLDIICRHAVDRSQGQLTEIHIDYFATDELLQYISERTDCLQSSQGREVVNFEKKFGDYRLCSETTYLLPFKIADFHRSSKLRCLRLGGCYGLSDCGLREAAKKFPLLEELHFVKNCNYSIEAIGHSCAKLKSFTLSESECKRRHLINDDDALAIAKSMPGLCHLQLLGINMTNKGLQAILDGCPLLESLDIRRCFNVDLCGDLGESITQKIKDFKHPCDSIDSSEWDTDIFDFEEYDEEYYYSSGYSDVDSIVDYYVITVTSILVVITIQMVSLDCIFMTELGTD